MKEYAGREIRNVAVVGHGASGKTSLVDAMAFAAGASKRHVSIKEGTTLTDFTPEETERALREKLPKRYWITFNDLLVPYGQNLCQPVSPYLVAPADSI